MPNEMIEQSMLLPEGTDEYGLEAAEDEEAEAQRIAAANEHLIGAIESYESGAIGSETDQIAIDRAKAIDYYLGNPGLSGDIEDIEGRSKVVSKDTFDTIEWIKPALLRIFAAGDKIVEFQPQNEDDVKAAEQESDYIDYVLQRKNPWFSIAYEWFTDALLTRNAYALGNWEVKTDNVIERYKGLTDDQMALIMIDESVEITKHEAYQAPAPVPPQMAMQLVMSGMLGQMPPMTMHNIEVRRSKENGCAKICVLPPERCLIAQDTSSVSVRDSNFFEYWEYKPISLLRSEGYIVEDSVGESSRSSQTGFGVIEQARDTLTEVNSNFGSGAEVDPSMRKVKARWVWLRHDYDGDGIAEMRHVVLVGNDILRKQDTGEECNIEVSGIPVASIVPYPMPHRHIGLSIHDIVADIQLIKTAMERQVIDNTYLANNGRYGVDKNRVNMDDFLVSRPGGQVRVDGPPHDAIMPFVHPQTAAQGIQVIEYLDGIRQDRGGVSKPYAGSDVSSIMAQPGTVAQLTNSASQKIELLARVIGEGVKELVMIIHELTLSNPTMPEKVRLRGQWVTIDPRQWKARSDMSLSVGMGIMSRPQQAAALQSLLALQKEALPVGLSDLSKLYNGYAKFTEALGFASGAQFFNEPPPNTPFKPPPDTMLEAVKVQEQGDALVAQMKANSAMAIESMKQQHADSRSYFETMIKQQNEAQDRFVRMISEATDRMQEMRIESARTPAKNETTVQVGGLDAISKAADRMVEAANATRENAAATEGVVRQMKEESAKKRKRTIKTDKGKTYTVEEE